MRVIFSIGDSEMTLFLDQKYWVIRQHYLVNKH